MNAADRIAIQIGRLTLNVLECSAKIDEQESALDRAYTTLSDLATDARLDAVKLACPGFALWCEKRAASVT